MLRMDIRAARVETDGGFHYRTHIMEHPGNGGHILHTRQVELIEVLASSSYLLRNLVLRHLFECSDGRGGTI